MNYNEWALKHPHAAAELAQITAGHAAEEMFADPRSESYAQQQARFDIARAGGLSWRNNVGATPAKIEANCPKCGFRHEIKQRVVRYGLANDSEKLNAVVKSSDLIGVVPRLITPQMVGTTIGQFLAVECKRPGWKYSGKGREVQQQSFLTAVLKKGGFAQFSTGAVQL